MQTHDLDFTKPETVPEADGPRAVHVRINVCGERIIGWVDLPPVTSSRCSGLLNDEDRYLTVRVDSASKSETIALNKEVISYVEVVGEPRTTHWNIPGVFHPVVIELTRPDVVLHGELFILADTEVADVLNDSRRFISVRNAQFVDALEAYAFLAMGKAQTRAVHF